MDAVDSYISEVIGKGDEGSALLAKLVAPTLKNCGLVDVVREGMNGIAVLRVPEGKKVLVHSAAGDPGKRLIASHVDSLVERLLDEARSVNARPVAFADVVDANAGDIGTINEIGYALRTCADKHGLAIMNGELAILGSRVHPSVRANLSGTMISLVDVSNPVCAYLNITFGRDRSLVGRIFDPEGKAVYINSDGVGTKLELYERSGHVIPAVFDFAAMNLDDASKLGARVRVVAGVLERDREGEPVASVMSRALRDALSSLDIGVCIAEEDVGGRIVGFSPESPAFNLSGSVVSTIDEDYLKNPLVPSAGEYLVAIAGVPNPRSNGITSKRKLMVDMLGADWHDSRMGRAFLGYLATPSTLFYPVFRELADQHLATSFYHMSGGAYNGKLARPLAKHGLFAEIDSTQLFQPDWRESAIQHLSGTSNENAYQQWPMGNDGFITTSEPEKAISVIERRGLKARVVAKLEVIRGGKTGVLLKGITGSDDADVYYSGKAA